MAPLLERISPPGVQTDSARMPPAPTANVESLTRSIEKTAADSQLRSDGEYLVFGGNVKAGDVKLYTSDGVEVATKFTTASGGLRLRLSSLRKGVYLININGRTSKFMKR